MGKFVSFELRSLGTQRDGLLEKLSNCPPSINGLGMGPESRLLEKLIELGSKLERLSGILPSKTLLERSSTLSDFNDDRVSGIEELSLFFCKINEFSHFKLLISEGIGPDKRLLLRSILTRVVACEISGGRIPDIMFLGMSSSDKFLAFPIVLASEPLKLL